MKQLKVMIATIACGLALTTTVQAQSIDINEELIEADALGLDSEASIIEAEQLKKQLAEEKREAQALKERLEREKEQSIIERRKADQKIAKNEKQIAAAQKKIKNYHDELKKIEQANNKKQNQMEKVQAKLDAVVLERNQVANVKKDRENELKRSSQALRNMRARAKSTALQVSKMRKEVRQAKVKIAKVYRDTNKDKDAYKKMINTYRRTLGKASQMLDELEMSIEIDQAYDNKLSMMGLKRSQKHRTVSGLNKDRVANVSVSSCNVRALPSKRGQILGSYRGGEKVKMKYHSRSWYAVIYGGEKAFLGKGCFN